MKKVLLFFTAAAVLAACAKTEVIPVQNVADQEITFETSPITKTAADNQKDFGKKNVFASYAYYHKSAWNWGGTQDDTPALYIGTQDATTQVYTPATISWVGDATTGVWKDATRSYYWPKDGKLTFFAWSLNKENLDFAKPSTTSYAQTQITVSPKTGIYMMYYDVVTDKNVDFLVAEVAADKTKNENEYYRQGVPTLFKHKLTMIDFTAKVKDAAYATNGVTFALDTIKFRNVSDGVGYYMQYPEKLAASSNLTTQIYTEEKQAVTSTVANIPCADQYIYIPQEFTKDTQVVQISYTVSYDTNHDGTPDFSEKITETKKLSELTGNWGIGKKYTINIIFSLDEILWDPAVEDWDAVAGKDVTVG